MGNLLPNNPLSSRLTSHGAKARQNLMRVAGLL
jgi:hypothetical protein